MIDCSSVFCIPIELFLGIIATALGIGIFGMIKNPQVPLLIAISGIFIFVLAAFTQGIILGKIPESSTVDGDTTSYVMVDNVFEFTDIYKVLVAMIGVTFMIVGAIVLRK